MEPEEHPQSAKQKIESALNWRDTFLYNHFYFSLDGGWDRKTLSTPSFWL